MEVLGVTINDPDFDEHFMASDVIVIAVGISDEYSSHPRFAISEGTTDITAIGVLTQVLDRLRARAVKGWDD